MMRKKILITGASGFVGTNLLQRIVGADGFEASDICVLSRRSHAEHSDFCVIESDLSQADSYQAKVKDFNPDAFIHLAWEGIPDYGSEISLKNLKQSVELVDFLAGETSCKQMLFSGSCWEYGVKEGICEESQAININLPFSWAKQSLAKYSEWVCAQKGMQWNWFRLFYIYGPGQRMGSLIPTVIDAFRKGQTPDVRSPLNANDFIFVEDVANLFATALEVNLTSGVYNFGSGELSAVLDICRIAEAKICGKTTWSDAVAVDLDTSQAPQGFWASNEKLDQALMDLSQTKIKRTSLTTGIEKYIDSLE